MIGCGWPPPVPPIPTLVDGAVVYGPRFELPPVLCMKPPEV